MGYQPSPAQRQIAPPAAVWRSMNIGLGLGVVRFCACGREGFGQCDAQRELSALTEPERKGQQLGLYESLLSLAILPAGLAGGVLWFFVGPWLTFLLASLSGLAGCAVYWLAGPPSQEVRDQ